MQAKTERKITKAHITGAKTARELVLTRVIHAPREMVYAAWTDPKSVAQWWGPRGFKNTVTKLDVEPGGVIHIDMRGPDGSLIPMTGVVLIATKPERLIFTSSALDKNGEPLFQVLNIVTFYAQGDDTTLTVRSRVIKKTHEGIPMLKGMGQGWSQSLNRLAESVNAPREIISTRVLNTPRRLVFKAWTDPDILSRWWGPKDFTSTFQIFDMRAGGVWRFVMHGPGGVDYPNKIVFKEVVKPERIVFNHLTGPQFQATATFAELAGKTWFTYRMLFNSAAECARIKAFAVRANEQTFDRMESELATMA